MGKLIQLDNGIQIEVNTVLALRPYASEGRHADECVPSVLNLGSYHNFIKEGYRIYNLLEPIPLLITRGEQDFTEALAMVRVFHCQVEAKADDIPGTTYLKYPIQTRGKFKVISLIEVQSSPDLLIQAGA